jgi:hypothetical protein
VRRAEQAGLVGMDLHALDGTKIRAACSMHTALHREAEKKLTKLNATLQALEEHASALEPPWTRRCDARGPATSVRHATGPRAVLRLLLPTRY